MSGRYGIKECFDTLQGEGERAGQRSVFLRFTGCNAWDGHPLHRDRGAGACARWCDTDFFKGKVMDTESILAAMEAEWPKAQSIRGPRQPAMGVRWVVLTGGEPGLQLDIDLVNALHDAGWAIACETNGSIDTPAIRSVDHLTVSPKRGLPFVIDTAHELKVVLPGEADGAGWTDAELEAIEARGRWGKLYVQPMDPPLSHNVEDTLLRRQSAEDDEGAAEYAAAIYSVGVKRCIDFIKAHPRWALSQQTHKHLGLR